MHRVRPTSHVSLCLVASVELLAGYAGCVAPGTLLTPTERAAAAAAKPILEMDPDTNWTACFNELVELGPASVSYLARCPLMRRRAAPDDLGVALHTSLLRLLADPATAPRLSANCLETTLDLLHFDLKVRGHRLGRACLAADRPPPAWHELYPASFDHQVAAQIDVEADRQAMRRWWLAHVGQPSSLVRTRPLRPRAEHLWSLLSRRYADRWTYQPLPEPILCAGQGRGAEMLESATADYNLVRTACIWLGSSQDAAIQNRLIDLVGSPLPVVAHNSRFALKHSRDKRVRETLLEFEQRQGAGLRSPARQHKPNSVMKL